MTGKGTYPLLWPINLIQNNHFRVHLQKKDSPFQVQLTIFQMIDLHQIVLTVKTSAEHFVLQSLCSTHD